MDISNLREPNYKTKQEGANEQSKIVPRPNLTTSSWSRLKDPRIVRVSRAFGGKDRHSKVCTVRGLRDRRVRLSVPTAIQLYDLQDRLGLNQPSKVVDWLLEAAKNEIDELPPLQIPPGSSFGQNVQAMISASSQEVKTTSGLNWEDCWNPDKSKVSTRETIGNYEDSVCEDATQARNKQHHGTFVQSSNFLERNHNSSNLPRLMNNIVPNSSFLKWDPSNLSLSQFGSYGSVVAPHQHDNTVQNFNMPSGSQILLYPPPTQTQTQSYLLSHNHNSGVFDPKQLDFQMASSSSNSSFTPPLYTTNQGMRPFHLSMNPSFFSSQDNGGHEPSKRE